MADKLIELLYENNVRCDIGIESLAEDIRSIFADVQRGKWIYMEIGELYKCSVCGNKINFYEEDFFNFCPQCGAKLDSPETIIG